MPFRHGFSVIVTTAFFGVSIFSGHAFAEDIPPLPEGIVILAPDASVQENIAGFVGTWEGISDLGPTTMKFVVTEVNAAGDALAIYAWAAGEEKGFQGPVVAKIEGNMLTMPAIFGPDYSLTFEMQADGSLTCVYGVLGSDKTVVKEYPSVFHKVN